MHACDPGSPDLIEGRYGAWKISALPASIIGFSMHAGPTPVNCDVGTSAHVKSVNDLVPAISFVMPTNGNRAMSSVIVIDRVGVKQ